MSKLRYLGTYISPILALISFNFSGVLAYLGIIVLYILVPILENLIQKIVTTFLKMKITWQKKIGFIIGFCIC